MARLRQLKRISCNSLSTIALPWSSRMDFTGKRRREYNDNPHFVEKYLRFIYPGHPRHFVNSGDGVTSQTRCILRVIVRWSGPPNDVVIITWDVLLSMCSTLRHSTRKKSDCANPYLPVGSIKRPGYGLSAVRILYVFFTLKIFMFTNTQKWNYLHLTKLL